MTEEINPSELGAFTNNLSNKEGIKKLVSSLEGKQEKLTAGSNVAISDQNVISATDTKYTAGDNIAISDENVISATDTKYTAGTGISISEQNVISASGGADSWELCENGCYDVYDDTNNEYIYTTRIQDGWIFFTHENSEALNQVAIIRPSLGKTYGDLQFFTITTLASDKSKGKITWIEYSIGSASNIALKPTTTTLYDLITNTQISASDINLYIDATTKEVLKPFVAKLRNGDYVIQFNIGAKEAAGIKGYFTNSTYKTNSRTVLTVTTDNILTIVGGSNVTLASPVFGVIQDNSDSTQSWTTKYIYRKKHNLPFPPTN